MKEIFFLTSSNEKLVHARHVFSEYDLSINKQNYYGKGYIEPRVLDRETLLSQSYEDAIRRWQDNGARKRAIFYFEDTSVRIDALSDGEHEVPGVEVKFWMQNMDFATLNEILVREGGNRKVTVRSDIVLSVPISNDLGELEREKVHFTSWTDGFITNEEYSVKTNSIYPWLNGENFNKWFVPFGAKLPLSLLPIQEADRYDFRRDAYGQMKTYLESAGLIKKKAKTIVSKQLHLEIKPHHFIIVGPKCAGKTTMGTFLQENYGYYHIEASDIMQLKFHQTHGANNKVRIVDFAGDVLRLDKGVVAKPLANIANQKSQTPIVITGFRSPEEIDIFMKYFDDEMHTKVVYVDANVELRFERNIRRRRMDSNPTLEEFQKDDRKQFLMGLSEMADRYFNESLIVNESTPKDYFSQFTDRYQNEIPFLKERSLSIYDVPPNRINGKSLEEVIVLTLYTTAGDGSYYSTTEISHLIAETFPDIVPRKNKNNISRYFNMKYYHFYEVLYKDGRNLYRLSRSGVSEAERIIRHFDSRF